MTVNFSTDLMVTPRIVLRVLKTDRIDSDLLSQLPFEVCKEGNVILHLGEGDKILFQSLHGVEGGVIRCGITYTHDGVTKNVFGGTTSLEGSDTTNTFELVRGNRTFMGIMQDGKVRELVFGEDIKDGTLITVGYKFPRNPNADGSSTYEVGPESVDASITFKVVAARDYWIKYVSHFR